MRTVTLIPGTTPPLTSTVARLVQAAGAKLNFEEASGSTPELAAVLRRTRVALAGSLPGGSLPLRRALDLFAGLRPVRSCEGAVPEIDIVVVRENLEDLSSGAEHAVGRDAVSAARIVTREGSRRIAHAAFEYAARNARRKVTAVHETGLLPAGDGLFLEAVRDAARDYAQLAFEERDSDTVARDLASGPQDFDVLLCTGRSGDLLAAMAAGLAGGAGFAPAVQMNREVALFEAAWETGGAAALIRAGCLLLEHLNEQRAADRLSSALAASLPEAQLLEAVAARLR